MPHFRCLPMPQATAGRFRASGRDDRGNPLRRVAAGNPGGFPCRVCLCCAEPGEDVLLGSYDLPRPLGIYWTPSPVFLHAEPCPAFAGVGVVAPIVLANPLVSVRACDRTHQCLYDLGEVVAGSTVAAPLARALEDTRTCFISIHTARPGCLLAQVERIV